MDEIKKKQELTTFLVRIIYLPYCTFWTSTVFALEFFPCMVKRTFIKCFMSGNTPNVLPALQVVLPLLPSLVLLSYINQHVDHDPFAVRPAKQLVGSLNSTDVVVTRQVQI